ncbi:MAG: hypothetical protein LBI82_00500 [Dysgonamonadaceae bacterium]|nr:hypothetical protein [Dysgonamonadaceae bacterium]
MKTKLGQCLCAILLLLFCTNAYAGYESSYSPFENSHTMTNNNNTKFLSNPSVNNGYFEYSPFGSNINKASGDFGDRPGDGEGIGQVPMRDSLIFLIILSIAYGLWSRYRLSKNQPEE